jgi:hypothetical protein
MVKVRQLVILKKLGGKGFPGLNIFLIQTAADVGLHVTCNCRLNDVDMPIGFQKTTASILLVA